MARSPRKKKAKPAVRKITDDADQIRTSSGRAGLRREEIWVDGQNNVVRYNLAYIDHILCPVDNGRVVGYDNAHGFHERHSMGNAEEVPFVSYAETVARFDEEIRALRKES